jgi:choline-sulfatase
MKKPNLLILMADQLQREPTDPESLCRTPYMDKLINRGVHFTRAYTANPVCSPARASLMTGQLPHNHGVLWVTHTMDKDQAVLRKERIHWAQHLKNTGYGTGYFGKWHVTHEEDPSPFGWEVNGSTHSQAFKDLLHDSKDNLIEKTMIKNPGYRDSLFSGITSVKPENRAMGVAATLALDFLKDQKKDSPWCCMVSVPEPHDPFVCGEEAYEFYRGVNIPEKENWEDDMEDKPAFYRRSRDIIESQISKDDWKEAVRRYYASITEIDSQFGRVLDYLEDSGQIDNTLILLTTDHGDFLGAHGIYCKNIGAFEEALNIPLIAAGPGIARGKTTTARVGTQDIHPTLLEYFGLEKDAVEDSRSFLPVLKDPAAQEGHFSEGFCENYGGRFLYTQRIFYRDTWKYVLNGFDYDELYDLENDPGEMINLAQKSEYREKLKDMAAGAWNWMKKTNDHTLVNSHYPPLRLIGQGPLDQV